MKSQDSTAVERQIAATLIRSALAAIPEKRRFPDALLLKIFKQAVDLGVKKFVLRPSSRTAATSTDQLSIATQPSPFITEKIREFAGHTENGDFTVYDKLPKLIAPHIQGALASSPDYPVHLLLTGEPATVKTELLDEAKKIMPEAVSAGPRSTQPGLTANLSNGGFDRRTRQTATSGD
jgi:hypothetical protein